LSVAGNPRQTILQEYPLSLQTVNDLLKKHKLVENMLENQPMKRRNL